MNEDNLGEIDQKIFTRLHSQIPLGNKKRLIKNGGDLEKDGGCLLYHQIKRN